MIGIYKIENLINHKKYIGQSIDIYERWQEHKRINERNSKVVKQSYPLYRAFNKYGIDNFLFEVIEECDREELDEKERYWISYYHTYINDPQCNGYNLTIGGCGNQQITNEEIQNFISLWEQNLSTGEISLITERTKHVIIRYLKLYCPSYSTKESDERGRVKSGISHRKAISRYDLLGNLIASYEYIKQAEVDSGISASVIIKNAKHQTTTCHDTFFFYDSEDLEECLKLHYSLEKFCKPVVQFNAVTNEPIACFSSAKAAAKQFKVDNGRQILECCQNKKHTSYGYKWKFITYEDIEQYNLREIGIQGENNIKCCYFCEQHPRTQNEVFCGYSCNNTTQPITEYFNLCYCPVCGKKITTIKE